MAGEIQVSPVRIVLNDRQPTVAMTVRNTGDTPVLVQMEATRWRQEHGRDSYTDTTDLLVNPRIFVIPAQRAQTVRIGQAQPHTASDALAYRIFIHEVPHLDEKTGEPGLKVLLKLGVPLFVSPAAPVRSKLEWKATRFGNAYRISLVNKGNTHIQVSRLALFSSQDPPTALADQKVFTYVLPGSGGEWLIDHVPRMDERTMMLAAETDHGPIRSTLVVEDE